MVKQQVNNALDIINIKINTLKNDAELNQEAITALNRAIQDIEQQKSRMIEDIKSSHSELIAKRCVDYIGSELNKHADELGQSLINKNHQRFNEMIITTIRDGLSFKLSREFRVVGLDIVRRFETETLYALNDSMKDFGMDEQWVAALTNKINQAFEITGKVINKIREHSNSDAQVKGEVSSGGNADKARSLYRLVGSVVAISTGIAAPAVELVIIFLPDIISFVGKRFQDQKIKQAISSDVIPGIKSELAKTLPTTIEEQIQTMVEDVSASFEEELNEKKTIIEQLERERQENKVMVDGKIAKLQAAKVAIMNLTESELY